MILTSNGLGSKTPQCPKGTKLVTVNADSSHSQQFYLCTRGENTKEGVFATFDLLRNHLQRK